MKVIIKDKVLRYCENRRRHVVEPARRTDSSFFHVLDWCEIQKVQTEICITFDFDFVSDAS